MKENVEEETRVCVHNYICAAYRLHAVQGVDLYYLRKFLSSGKAWQLIDRPLKMRRGRRANIEA